jgi:hypothetical protein
MDIYKQSTGQLFRPDGSIRGTGYAGRGEGKNNPAMENIEGTGPLPQGYYTAQEPRDDPKVGVYAMPLDPSSLNEMFGRSAFFMHGDSAEHPGEASEGCIVMPKDVRLNFWLDSDHLIKVIA